MRSPASRQTASTRPTTLGQRTAPASTAAQISFTRLAMDAMVNARSHRLKMPRLDAYGKHTMDLNNFVLDALDRVLAWDLPDEFCPHAVNAEAGLLAAGAARARPVGASPQAPVGCAPGRSPTCWPAPRPPLADVQQARLNVP